MPTPVKLFVNSQSTGSDPLGMAFNAGKHCWTPKNPKIWSQTWKLSPVGAIAGMVAAMMPDHEMPEDPKGGNLNYKCIYFICTTYIK